MGDTLENVTPRAIAGPVGEVSLGRLVMTRGVNNAVAESATMAKAVIRALRRYRSGDWGEVAPEDKALNDRALAADGRNGDDRILASYSVPGSIDGKIWIITEWDRSVTTVLFPSEY